MTAATHPKKRHTLLKIVIVLLLAVVVGFGVWLGTSAKKVADLLSQATIFSEQVQAKIDEKDYDAALAAARKAAGYTSQASVELNGTQWDIAARIPVLGDDVETVRSIGSISGNLADNAVLPVLDSWEQLASDGIISDGSIELSKVPEKFSQLVELAKTLQESSLVVDDCSARANALPASHFNQINEWTAELKKSVESADATFDEFGGVIDLVVNVSNALSTLSNSTVGAQS